MGGRHDGETMTKHSGAYLFSGGWAIAIFVFFAAWVTHIVTCLTFGKWGFLIAGALFFPIGIIHGFGVWFGAW